MPRKLSLKAYADNSITTAAIANDAVTAAKIPSGAVVADIADGSITTAKIADDAVTTAKIGAAAVTGTEIHTNAVTAAHLPDGYGTDLIGVIISYPKDTLPTGFLACDGSAVSRSTYSGLFAVVGTTYGTGDGSSTFNVPDLRATFLRGSGDQTYSSKAYSGGTAGTKKIQSLMDHQGRQRTTWHTHYGWDDQYTGFFNPHSNWSGQGRGVQLGSSNDMIGAWGDTSTNKTYARYSNSDTANDETRPFGMAVKFCIKY